MILSNVVLQILQVLCVLLLAPLLQGFILKAEEGDAALRGESSVARQGVPTGTLLGRQIKSAAYIRFRQFFGAVKGLVFMSFLHHTTMLRTQSRRSRNHPLTFWREQQ